MDLVKIYNDSDFSEASVPPGEILIFTGRDPYGKVVTRYKDSSGNFGTIAGNGGSSADVTLGQVNADGNFQALSFNGTEASNSGDPETVENYYGWNGVLPVPDKGIKIGEAAEYYKCASVDTANKTWAGYKLVLTDGIYSFEETVTEGLTFGNGFYPAVGQTYNSDATITAHPWIGMPSAGLVFYAPFTEQLATAETGQALVKQGNDPSFVIQNGIPCMRIQNTRIDTSENSGITGGGPITLSAWFMDVGGGGVTSAVNNGDNSGASMVAIGASGGYAFCSGYGGSYDWVAYDRTLQDRMHHVLCTYGDSVIRLYVDGQKVIEEYTDISMQPNTLCIGSAHGSYYFDGYIGHVRMYNRVLDYGEIAELASEFTPAE